jgi:hypothetical protein
MVKLSKNELSVLETHFSSKRVNKYKDSPVKMLKEEYKKPERDINYFFPILLSLLIVLLNYTIDLHFEAKAPIVVLINGVLTIFSAIFFILAAKMLFMINSKLILDIYIEILNAILLANRLSYSPFMIVL